MLLDMAAKVLGRTGVDPKIQTKTSPTDPVTEADHAAEALIFRKLKRARPNDTIVAEEGSGSHGSSGINWLIDPLDGTVNYIYGLPHWCVSIGIEGLVRLGIIYDPSRDEMFSPRAGENELFGLSKGSSADRSPESSQALGEPGGSGAIASPGGSAPGRGRFVPLNPSRKTELAESLIGTGFSYSPATRGRQADIACKVIPQVRDIRRAGSCALDLAWVACGRLDGFYEEAVQPWDISAGIALIEAAGGSVRRHGDLTIAAGTPQLREKLENLVLADSDTEVVS